MAGHQQILDTVDAVSRRFSFDKKSGSAMKPALVLVGSLLSAITLASIFSHNQLVMIWLMVLVTIGSFFTMWQIGFFTVNDRGRLQDDRAMIAEMMIERNLVFEQDGRLVQISVQPQPLANNPNIQAMLSASPSPGETE